MNSIYFYSGVKNLDSGVGIYAPDPESYNVFAELFNPIIEDYHKGFGKDDQHPAPFFGEPKDFGVLDPKVRSDLKSKNSNRIINKIKNKMNR